MLGTSFSPWPSFTNEEADAIREVLLSNRVNYWTGRVGREFEEEFAAFADCDKAIALANGTVALELALQAINLERGDEVIVTPRTFIASVSSVLNSGGVPVFADVDRDSQNIEPATIEPRISKNTKAIVAVHLAGWPCDMKGLCELAEAHQIRVIEDCAQAHGAKIYGRSVGSWGDIGAWSFCQDKIMTTGGEGGMVTTNDHSLWESMWSYKDHGKSYEAVYEREHPPGFRWLHEGFGTNYRMTELQAAIGRIQLGRMPQWHAGRDKNATEILAAAAACPALRVPVIPDHIRHAWYKCYAFVRPERLRSDWSRDRVVQEITQRGVPCFQGSCSEVYLETAFEDSGLAPAERLPVARELGETSLMFLVHPTLTNEEIATTCQVLSDVMVLATR